MRKNDFERQAEYCRGQALAYCGKPESLVLLRIAREFDRLAQGRTPSDPQSEDVVDLPPCHSPG